MIRNDFVSNSSSSSFIITNNEIFEDTTLDDIKNALKDLGPNSFEIYDLQDKKDFELYKKSDLFELNDDWLAPHVGKRNIIEKFAAALDLIGVYEFKYADKKITKDDFKYYTYRTGKLKEDRRAETKPLPEYFRQAFNFLYDISGVKTMAEVAVGGCARYIIHYGDNEVWALKGMTDIGSEIPSYKKNDKEYVEKSKQSIWETESYCGQRFYEILIKYLADKKIVDLNADKVLNFWHVPEDHWWKREDRYKNRKYFFEGEKPSMKEIIDEMVMPIGITHEG